MGLTTDPGFPAIGRTLSVRFGETHFRLDFQDAQRMSFVGLAGPYQGARDTVQYTAVKIREQVYMVYWHEPLTAPTSCTSRISSTASSTPTSRSLTAAS